MVSLGEHRIDNFRQHIEQCLSGETVLRVVDDRQVTVMAAFAILSISDNFILIPSWASATTEGSNQLVGSFMRAPSRWRCKLQTNIAAAALANIAARAVFLPVESI
jgi:hypothetical protein